MAYTQSDLTNLQKAMASGVKQAMRGDEMVQYRSLAEMERIEEKMKRDLGLTTGSRLTYPTTASGW